eukprot:PITA_19403
MKPKGKDDVCDIIFHKHFVPRRTALLRAFTQGVPYLCLYAYSEGTWDLKKPEDQLPCNPEPYIGVNKKMLEMSLMEWIRFVARWSDSWLMSDAFFMEPHLNAKQRAVLFRKINSLGTLVEEIERHYALEKIPQHVENVYNMRKVKASVAGGHKPMEVDETATCTGGGRDAESEKPNEKSMSRAEDDQIMGEKDETHCGSCDRLYKEGEFWIQCDDCDIWYHGRCVRVTQKQSKNIDLYTCPHCRRQEVAKKKAITT